MDAVQQLDRPTQQVKGGAKNQEETSKNWRVKFAPYQFTFAVSAYLVIAVILMTAVYTTTPNLFTEALTAFIVVGMLLLLRAVGDYHDIPVEKTK